MRTQLPLLAATAFLSFAVLLAHPESYRSEAFLVGLAIIGVASIASAALPWERWSANWLIGVALADMIGVAALRVDLIAVIPTVGLLVVFPVLWLAYGFPGAVVSVGVGGALLVSALPHLLTRAWPEDALEWVNVIMLPAIVVGITIVAQRAAQRLRRGSSALSAAGVRQDSSDRREESILATITAGVAFYDADDTLQLANGPVRRMLALGGIPLDHPPHAGADVLLADRATAIPFEEQIIPRSLRGEQVTDHVEWLGVSGSQIAIVATSRRVLREDGALLGTVIVTHDVTELADAVAVREEFLRTVSHELRTPLTAIVGYLELIEDALPADDFARPHLEVVSRNSETLLSRITELLTAADTEPPIRLRSADLTAVARDAIENVRAAAERKQISLVQVQTRSVTGRVDPGRMLQVLDQVLANAVKFTPDGGMVRLDVMRTDEAIEISVADTGIGMTPDEQRQAFDRFYRSQSALEGAVQGVGLGLPIAKKIVDAHDGQISLTSTAGEGTCVTVIIPTR